MDTGDVSLAAVKVEVEEGPLHPQWTGVPGEVIPIRRRTSMVEFSASWRMTLIVLAITSWANASVVMVYDSPMTRTISILSAASGVALVASQFFRIRKFTLVVTMAAMWMQAWESWNVGEPSWNRARISVVFFALGLLAFTAWVYAMRRCWPRLTQLWRLPMI